MSNPRGKTYAMLTIASGLASGAIAIYVLASCEFYEVIWTTDNGRTRTDDPGLLLCKYIGNDKNPEWDGPTNGFDMVSLIAGFGGPVVGLIATAMVFNSYWKCLCRVQNTALASCLFMMAVLLQGLTTLAIFSGACREGYDGECTLLRNAWLSVGAAGGWFLASCFNRETAPKPQ